MENNLIIAASFAVYGLAMLLLGGIACRRTRNLSDYIIGGRRLNSFVTALSAEASDMSGWLLLGLPGYAYVAGYEWVAVAWIAWICICCRM